MFEAQRIVRSPRNEVRMERSSQEDRNFMNNFKDNKECIENVEDLNHTKDIRETPSTVDGEAQFGNFNEFEHSTVEMFDTNRVRENENSTVELKERIPVDRFKSISESLKEARHRSENKMSLKRLTEYEVNNVDKKANQVIEEEEALTNDIGLIEEGETEWWQVI